MKERENDRRKECVCMKIYQREREREKKNRVKDGSKIVIMQIFDLI